MTLSPQPMSTAPKDRLILLAVQLPHSRTYVIGYWLQTSRWEGWSTNLGAFGPVAPDHWCEIPTW